MQSGDCRQKCTRTKVSRMSDPFTVSSLLGVSYKVWTHTKKFIAEDVVFYNEDSDRVLTMMKMKWEKLKEEQP